MDLLTPDDRQVLLTRIRITEPVDIGRRSFVAALVDYNPIIFTGRIVGKEPAFLDIWTSGALFMEVPVTDANWLGSYLTVQVERVIRTNDALPLVEGTRVTFVEDGDGSATINGVRVDAEDPRLWPIEAGKRYLITGDIKSPGRQREQAFAPSGMWLEPYDGAPLKGRSRIHNADTQVEEAGPTFERDVPRYLSSTTILDVTKALEREIAARKSSRGN